jgi:hypothetical protein
MLDSIEIEKSYCRADYRAAGTLDRSSDGLSLECGRQQELEGHRNAGCDQNRSDFSHLSEICLA